jgi:peptide/nickel transport system ATP-binding protein
VSVLLEVKNLKTYFINRDKTVPAVDGMDLTIYKGETVALVGESGSGKSITSLSIMGLVPEPGGKIVDGSIMFNGTNLVDSREQEMQRIRGNEIAMIFQEPMTSLNPTLTIGKQIVEVILHHEKCSKKDAKKRAIDQLKMVGFARAEEIYNEYPHRLSGGMRQRVMIAIAMSCHPTLLIADEPTTALDVTIQAQILELMRTISKEKNTSILLITHDLGVVSEMADRVVVMYAGQVVEEASIDDLFEEPLHPYTIGLIQSIPSIDEDIKTLQPIPGNVPSPEEFGSGCRFAARCSFIHERCMKENPPLVNLLNNRRVRCFLHGGGTI